MSLHLENEYEPPLSFDFDMQKTAAQVIEAVIDEEQCPYECDVALTLVDNETIHEINRTHRQIDRPTDVLSFPLIAPEAFADYDKMEAQAEDYFDPDSGELLLGDIVLSLDKVKSQAAEYGHSEKREYAFLIAHSMLHLFGYDHMTPEEAAVMEEKQRQILHRLQIER